jgi:hypothetical protein
MRTLSAGSARLSVAARPGDPVPRREDHRGDGEADFASRRVKVQDRFITDHGLDISRHRDSARVQRWKQVFAAPTGFVFDGGRRYARLPEKGWSADGARTDAPRNTQDPTWLFDPLLCCPVTVARAVGDAVQGVPATRYGLGIDLQGARDGAGQELRLPTRRRRRWFGRRSRDDGHLQAEVWIDQDGYIRRMAYLPFPGKGSDALWFVTQLRDFGAPVQISIPDA